MLKTRILTALVLLPLIFFALFGLQGREWALFVLLICVAGSWEWSRFAGLSGAKGWGYTAVTALAGFGLLYAGVSPVLGLLLAAFSLLFWGLVAPLWLKYKWRLAGAGFALPLGWAILFSSWHAMVVWHEGPSGAWLLLSLMAVAWVADTAAYFSGRRFGKRKLAPTISPGKSWEGVMGAYVGVTIYGIAIANSPLSSQFGGYALLPAIWILTGLSVVGDLLESLFKRQVGLKDSSNLLPGHGGILDRIDSQLAVLPVSAALLTLSRLA